MAQLVGCVAQDKELPAGAQPWIRLVGNSRIERELLQIKKHIVLYNVAREAL